MARYIIWDGQAPLLIVPQSGPKADWLTEFLFLTSGVLMTRESQMFCEHRAEGNIAFRSFYSTAFQVRLIEGKFPIVAVSIREREWDRSQPRPSGYWGWWSNEDSSFHFVWPSRIQVEMCFPYGPEAEEKRGRGHLLPVEVVLLRNATPEEIRPHDYRNKSNDG
jgi:hypothetical protein